MNSLTIEKIHEAKPVKYRIGAVFETHSDKPLNLSVIRDAVHRALHAVDGAKQLCLAAGQILNEVKDRLPHGEFLPWVKQYLPEISEDTAQRWARAAGNITKFLPPPTIDIPVSDILITPDENLSPAAKKYKQSWFDFTADKTIKDCLAGVFVEGNEAHSVDRAINGKTKGGTNKFDDRKDYPLFMAVKGKDQSGHLKHWNKMADLQHSEIEQVLRAMIIGDSVTLSRKQSRTFKFEKWPEHVCKVVLDACKIRLKGNQ